MWQQDFKSRFGLNDSQLLLLERFCLLLSSAREINITAIKDESKIIDVLFRDSLVLLDLPEALEAAKAVDIGSGGGIPGMLLAIARPGLDLTMIEANRKKCAFISKVIEALGLKNAAALELRSEEAASSQLRDSFDFSVTRAVAPLSAAIEYSLPLVRPGGFALLLRGKREQDDNGKAKRAARALNGSIDRIVRVSPYDYATNLHVWLIKKEALTPARFPRKPGMAKKRPLA